ncbi:hypothetical protein Mapa_014509 [Marchantia paleacea]|nr:hypothetical protein Mapa_014509 [Marchantia paleacea]
MCACDTWRWPCLHRKSPGAGWAFFLVADLKAQTRRSTRPSFLDRGGDRPSASAAVLPPSAGANRVRCFLAGSRWPAARLLSLAGKPGASSP